MLPKSWLWGGALSMALLFAAITVKTQAQLTDPTAGSRSSADAGVLNAAEEQATNADILDTIVLSDVVYLAETHDDPADHAAQLEIVQGLNEKRDIAIGLEMFQRPFQPALDAYLSGELTEAELIEQSEYETRWGFDWEFYAPILRYAKANDIPLIALNTPAEITRKVALTGLESLAGDDLTYIPPVADIKTDNEDYQASVREVFSAHGGMGHSMNFENFFAAQVLWDETMAERVATQLQADPERQVIVLAGEAHILYGYGIPSRVARRVPEVDHASVWLAPDFESANEPGAADFVWLTSE